MGKERDDTHELEAHSRGRLQTVLSEWVLNPLSAEDYAFDFEIRPTEPLFGPSEVRPTPIFAQLKASESFDSADSVWWDFETGYLLDDVLRASVPVVLFIYDRDRDTFSWCVLQEYCWDGLDEERHGWRDQRTVRVRIGRNSISETLDREALKHSVEDVQRRISAREYIATVRSEPFIHPPGTTLASSQSVGEFQGELVDQARGLVDGGNVDQALEVLLRVYQIPERSPATAEAIRLLLELREMDSPAIAMAQLKFAQEGLPLASRYDRPELTDEFRAVRDEAWEYLERKFVGARYLNEFADLDLVVLEFGGITEGETSVVATVQYRTGEIDSESAAALATEHGYRLLESGAGWAPLEEACQSRVHEFEEERLRRLPTSATCQECGLSHETIDQLLGHDVPYVCDECGSVGYETTLSRDRRLCEDCAASTG